MSLAFHGVVFRATEVQARDWFAALHSRLPLRLVAIDEGVFGVYAKRQAKTFEALQRVATYISRFAGEALLYHWDNCIDLHCELFVLGRPGSEADPGAAQHQRRAGKDPLDAFGFKPGWHHIVEESFLWDQLEPLAESPPHYGA
jgi:hypothetical protein